MNANDIKILIIEDEQSLTDLLMAKLTREGFTMESAPDGEAGFEKIKSWQPDMILLDIQMPKMDGYEVLEKMNETNISIPVIIISNSGQTVEIEKTKRLGAVDHLIKTEFNPDDVVRKVKNYLETGVGEEDKAPIVKLENQDGKILGIKVLLVEDDKFLSDICSKKLVKEGYTVYLATDGLMAIEAANEALPDIILLDIILPTMDGFQILNEIRSSDKPELKKAPVIMLSNLGQDDDIKKAMEIGANDYLVKAHFTTDEIAAKIKTLLGR